MFMMVTTVKVRAREMVQLLRAYTAFPDYLSSDPSVHMILTTVKGPECKKKKKKLVRDCTRFTMY